MEAEKAAECRDEKKLNILFVISSLYWGGAQKVASILANYLADRYNVTVAYCFDSGRSHPLSEKCGIRKLPDYDMNACGPEKAVRTLGQIRALRRLKSELEIDVSVSLGNISNFINAMSKGKERVICAERSNPKRSWGRLFFLTRLAYRSADFVVFQSEQIRGFYGPAIREKSCILKNPLIIPAPASDRRERKVVALGRITAQKNMPLLLRSFSRFHERFPEYSLHIYGEGELEGQIRQQIRSMDLEEAIRLEGNDPHVHERIRDAEMFVLSSDFEGLSNALLECMSMGIACISTKCEGSVDVIRNGENGLLVDIGDEEALAKAMADLAQDPSLRRKLEGNAARDLKAYDWTTVCRDWELVIRQCAASGGRRKRSGTAKGD